MSKQLDPVSGMFGHLRDRCRQRGVAIRELLTLFEEADRLVPVGGGCVSLTVSRRAAASLLAEGIDIAVVERVCRRAIVAAPNGAPMTILVPQGRRGRRYRRGSRPNRRMH